MFCQLRLADSLCHGPRSVAAELTLVARGTGDTAPVFSTLEHRDPALRDHALRRSQIEDRRTMLFMVIEHFQDGNAEAVYRRLQEKGRMTPDGLAYVDSWVDASLDRCFQLVECEDARLIQRWIAKWDDLIDFDVVPVVSSDEAKHTVVERAGSATDGSSEDGEH